MLHLLLRGPSRVLTRVLVAATLLPRWANAQVELELGPYIGVYAPTGSFESDPLPSPLLLSSTSRHVTALAVGGSGVLWIAGRVGLGAELTTASSSVRTRSAGLEQERSARMTLGALQVLLPLRLSSLRGRGHVGAGLGRVWRSGDFYEGYEARSNTAAALGGGSKFSLARHLGVQLEIQTYLYSLHLRPESTSESTFQADLLGQVGLVLELQP